MYRLVTGLYQIEQDFICTSGLPSSSPVSRTQNPCKSRVLFFAYYNYTTIILQLIFGTPVEVVDGRSEILRRAFLVTWAVVLFRAFRDTKKPSVSGRFVGDDAVGWLHMLMLSISFCIRSELALRISSTTWPYLSRVNAAE